MEKLAEQLNSNENAEVATICRNWHEIVVGNGVYFRTSTPFISGHPHRSFRLFPDIHAIL